MCPSGLLINLDFSVKSFCFYWVFLGGLSIFIFIYFKLEILCEHEVEYMYFKFLQETREVSGAVVHFRKKRAFTLLFCEYMRIRGTRALLHYQLAVLFISPLPLSDDIAPIKRLSGLKPHQISCPRGVP